MTNPTDNPTAAQALRTLAGKCYYSGRSQMNLARDAERDAEALARPYGNAEAKAEAAESLPKTAARLIAAIEEQANRLPELRALSGVNGDAAAADRAIADGGMAIVVQNRCPTDARGARWTARFDRDAETVFRASAGFTYDDKDNDGSDNAAAACLAKFETYCNDLPETPHTVKVRFKLAARASLGRGAYAYTFRRI